MPSPTLLDLRNFAINRSLFSPTTLGRAISRLGFVQADPIRAPARAQDLTLRHRVNNYRAGDLEKHYPELPIEEDFFVNYGFLPRATHALMHPRRPAQALTALEKTQAVALIEFVRERGMVHPRDADKHFAHGSATNWFGGQSNVTTKLLEKLHFHGLLRVARRDAGTRVYALRDAATEFDTDIDTGTELDGLIDVIVNKYAPLPAASLGQLITYLMRGVPQHKPQRNAALQRAKSRLAHTEVDGVQLQILVRPSSDSPTYSNGRSSSCSFSPISKYTAVCCSSLLFLLSSSITLGILLTSAVRLDSSQITRLAGSLSIKTSFTTRVVHYSQSIVNPNKNLNVFALHCTA